ncbi:MAG TPA: tetratricopeptide repeat protein [Nitrospira sp.]|nr:tetratricopeptide repeat protein [Nitrospira sp.]
MTRKTCYTAAVARRSMRCLCGLICLTVLLACASPPPARMARSAEAAETPKSPALPSRPADASAAYHFMLGYQAELAQNSEQALKEYQAALKADPSALSVKARLASLHFSLGDMPNALRYAEEVADGNADDARMLTHMAGILAGGGKGDKALTVLDRAIQLEPESGEAYFSKGLLLLNLKRPAEAEEAMRAGIVRSPDNAVGHYHLGRILLEAGKVDEAMASFERAITVNAAFEPAYLALASMHEARHDKDRAVAVLRKYLQHVNPRNREIRHQLVRIYVDAKDYQGARKELEDLLAEDPSDLDAQLRMALIHGEQKEYAQAIDRLNAILKVRPAELKVRDYLGYIYEESKDTQKALEAYTFNVQLEPTFYEGHLHLGVLYYRLKKFPEANEHLARAIALNPKQPESHIVQGLAYLQQEQYDKSADVFLEGIRHNPKNADLYFNLGTAYDKLNRFDDVVKAMETAIALDPHHADALNYLGYSYADRGVRIDQAISLTKQAVALKPENGYYVDSLGWAFFKSGQLAEALVELKRAAALVGDDPVIYEHLGDIYAKQQRLSDAREAWLHALELDPTNLKLMDRFREQGMGDPAQEERIQQAKRKIEGQKPPLPIAQ